VSDELAGACVVGNTIGCKKNTIKDLLYTTIKKDHSSENRNTT